MPLNNVDRDKKKRNVKQPFWIFACACLYMREWNIFAICNSYLKWFTLMWFSNQPLISCIKYIKRAKNFVDMAKPLTWWLSCVSRIHYAAMLSFACTHAIREKSEPFHRRHGRVPTLFFVFPLLLEPDCLWNIVLTPVCCCCHSVSIIQLGVQWRYFHKSQRKMNEHNWTITPYFVITATILWKERKGFQFKSIKCTASPFRCLVLRASSPNFFFDARKGYVNGLTCLMSMLIRLYTVYNEVGSHWSMRKR